MSLALAGVLAGCANPPSGALAQGAIQGAINAIGAAGKPSGAAPSFPSAGGKIVDINATLVAVDGEHPSDPRWAGPQIKDTPLFRFFDAHPISRPGEYFPRVGVRIDDYSQSLVTESSVTRHLKGSPGATPRPLECIKFTAVIWMSEKQSQRVEGVVLCSSDISSKDSYLTLGALRNYRNLHAPFSISSMQVRTLGPRVPDRLLPDSTSDDVAMYGQGQHLFSALFSQLGYEGPIDGDQRMWFVNLSARAP